MKKLLILTTLLCTSCICAQDRIDDTCYFVMDTVTIMHQKYFNYNGAFGLGSRVYAICVDSQSFKSNSIDVMSANLNGNEMKYFDLIPFESEFYDPHNLFYGKIGGKKYFFEVSNHIYILKEAMIKNETLHLREIVPNARDIFRLSSTMIKYKDIENCPRTWYVKENLVSLKRLITSMNKTYRYFDLILANNFGDELTLKFKIE